MSSEVAVFAGGCFWCLEAAFEQLRGVESVLSGYAGGTAERPTYEDVCTGGTGHAEVVQVTFDPDVISYRDLVEVFFSIHDPTTPDRQGADIGTQYRSAIYYGTPEQERVARETVARLNREKLWKAPIVTEIEPLDTFYPAEEYHREYFRRNPGQGYCRAVIAPKVAKFREEHLARLRAGR